MNIVFQKFKKVLFHFQLFPDFDGEIHENYCFPQQFRNMHPAHMLVYVYIRDSAKKTQLVFESIWGNEEF